MTPDDDLEPGAGLFGTSAPPRPPVSRIRPALFAGRFYPADPVELRRAAQALIGQRPEGAPSRGLVLPHGPWRLVGEIAGRAIGRAPLEETVIVLGPNHSGRGPRGAIVCDGAYALPGGSVPIESTLAESIRALGGLAEAPEVFADEHAIESILPLLVVAQPRLSIVPIALHDQQPSTAARIGAAIADAIVGRGGGVTLVATTDIAHYVPATAIAEASDPIVERVAALDDEGFVAAVQARTARPGPIVETCGLGALLAFVHAMRGLRLEHGEVIARASSADFGDRGAATAWASLWFRD